MDHSCAARIVQEPVADGELVNFELGKIVRDAICAEFII